MRLLRHSAICSMLILASSAAQAADPGVSHALAIARAARVSSLYYALDFHLTPHSPTIAGRETLTFTDSGSGDLALDYRDGTISAASLNGKEIAPALDNGHLNLPAAALLKGKNELRLTFASQVAAAGKAFTRYEDRDDKNEYIYTLFVPMDASMAFPCFDQPDLKARFTLEVSAPQAWKVIANTAPRVMSMDGLGADFKFAETQPISTYLFAFAAGPFESLHGKAPGEPTVYVRKSQLARAQTEAPQVQQMAARGIKYFSDYFARSRSRFPSTTSSSSPVFPSAAWSMPAPHSSTKMACSFAPRRPRATTFAVTSLCCTRPAISGSETS